MPFEKIARRVGRDAVVLVLGSDQRAVGPDRPLVAAPEQRERPTRQLLARIPLSLAVVQKPLRREARAQPLDELGRELALGRSDGRRIPLRRVGVLGRDESRLAADRDPHVVGDELALDAVAEFVDRVPLLVAVGLRHARRLDDPAHRSSRARTSTRTPRSRP